jgi:hypothetical protein
MLGAAIFATFGLVANGYIIFRPVEEYGAINVTTYVFLTFLGLMLLRFFFISKYFNDSTIVQGVIKDIWFHKDRGRVTYVYQIDGDTYIKGSAIMKTKETRLLGAGSKVELIVKNANPKKAIIGFLYAKK